MFIQRNKDRSGTTSIRVLQKARQGNRLIKSLTEAKKAEVLALVLGYGQSSLPRRYINSAIQILSAERGSL